MKFLSFLGTASLAITSLLAADNKPNIIYILTDDVGYGDVGCYGATHLKTPNIDRLAKEGTRFTDAHATASVCTPTRFAFGSRVVSASGVAARVWNVPMGTARDAGQLAELAEAVSRHRVDDLGGVVPLGATRAVAGQLPSRRASRAGLCRIAGSLDRRRPVDPCRLPALRGDSAGLRPAVAGRRSGTERRQSGRSLGHPALVGQPVPRFRSPEQPRLHRGRGAVGPGLPERRGGYDWHVGGGTT